MRRIGHSLPMTSEERQRAACRIYRASGDVRQVVAKLGDISGVRNYTERHAAFDLWRASYQPKLRARRQRERTRFSFDAVDGKETEAPATYREFHLQAIARAFLDLEMGTPCTLGMGIRTFCPSFYPPCSTTRVNGTTKDHPYAHLRESGGTAEWHRCAPDALAWFTSTDFLELCVVLDWPWRKVMETVLTEAQITTSLFPWLALTPALVWRIACTLEGEAGVLGAKGMWYVGDTMLSRHARGDSWEEVLAVYYGYQEPPGETAMRLAERMVADPWAPSGRIYAYSEQDRAKMGWRRGDLVYGKGDWILHFTHDWPGELQKPQHVPASPSPDAIAYSVAVSVR